MQTIKARSPERAIINQPNQFRAVARLFATANQESPDFEGVKISKYQTCHFHFIPRCASSIQSTTPRQHCKYNVFGNYRRWPGISYRLTTFYHYHHAVTCCSVARELDVGWCGREQSAIRTSKRKCDKLCQTFIFQAPMSSLELDITRKIIANLVHAVIL